MGAIFILGSGDWLGRRKAMIMGGAIMTLGVIIQVTSESGHSPLAQFIAGRVITGVGNGINTSTIPSYQAECSRTTNRGLLICIEGGVIAFGTLVAYVGSFYSISKDYSRIVHGFGLTQKLDSGLTMAPPTADQI